MFFLVDFWRCPKKSIGGRMMKRLIDRLHNRFMRSYNNDIDYPTLNTMMRTNKKIWIIDVRTKDEFYSGHLNMAINVPLQDIREKIERIIKNKNELIVVYCQSGGRSRKACLKLEKLGYLNVYNLKGGIDNI